MGFAGHPDLRGSALGDIGASMAQVTRLLPTGSARLIADVGTYEVMNDPDADGADSNPYGILVLIDIEFGPDGSLYVLQIASPIPNFGGGALLRVAPDGTRTPIAGPLFAPGGIAIAKDGTIYVTNRSTSPGAGEVLRIRP